MKVFFRLVTTVGCLLFAAGGYANALNYEFIPLNSTNAGLQYPGLDFSQATTGKLILEKTTAEAEPLLKTLELNFSGAAKLVARDFKKVDGFIYRAVVNNQWIYRQVIVDIHIADINNVNSSPLHIEVAVSEKAGFINPEGEERGAMLLFADGELRNVTPNRIVDTASTLINGKRVNLALRANPSTSAPATGQHQEGFVIESTWMGKGQKTLYIPCPFPVQQFAFVDTTQLILEELDTPEGKDPVITVMAKDQNGFEIPSMTIRLHELLDQAYGMQP
jgi:hypothetical protein